MNDAKGLGKTLILLSLKNPYVLLVAIILILFLSIWLIYGLLLSGSNNSGLDNEGLYINCVEGVLDMDAYSTRFDGAGVFDGMGSTFIEIARTHQIDPVILGAIALAETGSGTSNMVRTRNNPGGLYNSREGRFFTYPTLLDGLDAMASNLYRLYISQGLFTISSIGAKYAPIGVANDPNNLNSHWVPNVTNLANELGGLSMNCEEANGGSGEFFKPIPNVTINSNYGTRVHPITGIVSFHRGVDLACRVGDPIYSASTGTVVIANKSGYGGGYGHYIVLNHGSVYTLYAHMTNVNVNVGNQVGRGQVIGTCGSTGASTGPHLHFEVQTSLMGQRVNPMSYFD